MAAVDGEFPREKAAPADGNHVSSLPRHRLTADDHDDVHEAFMMKVVVK